MVGVVADGGQLHGHGLAVVHQLVHAAVYDGVVLFVVALGVHHPGKIGATVGGQAPAQLQGNGAGEGHRLQQLGELLQIIVLRELVLGVIAHREAGAKLQFLHGVAQQLLQRLQELVHRGQLPGQTLHRGLLGAGEVLDALEVEQRVILVLGEDVRDLVLFQAKLVSTGQPQQQGHRGAAVLGGAADEVKLLHGLHREDGRGVWQDFLDELRGLVHPRHHKLGQGQALFCTDAVLAGGAQLQPLHQRGEVPGQERIGLDGVAQAYPIGQFGAQVGNPLLQGFTIEEVQGGGIFCEQGLHGDLIHGYQLLSSVVCGLFFRFCSGGTGPPDGTHWESCRGEGWGAAVDAAPWG